MRTGHTTKRRGIRPDAHVKSTLFLSLLSLTVPSALIGQQIVGTVIVIAKTKSRVIIAADSRVQWRPDGVAVQNTDDSYCKIAALGGGVVFAAAGIIGDRNQTWAATTKAADVVFAISHGNKIDSVTGDSVLMNWTAAMKQELPKFGSDALSAYAHDNAGTLVTGVLAGIETTGDVWVRALAIDYGERGFGDDPVLTFNLTDAETAYFPVGKNTIALAFLNDRTVRAIAERKAWRLSGLKGVAFDRFKTRRLVQLTIKYNLPKTDVGGPIDEIELDSAGIRWVQVKNNCQGDIAKKPTTKKKKRRRK